MTTPVLYVTGTSFTGSTLFAFLLNAHPDLASVGEVEGPRGDQRARRAYPCSCGQLVTDCHFFRRIEQEVNKLGHTFDPGNWQLSLDITNNKLARQFLVKSLGRNAWDDARDGVLLRTPGLAPRIRRRVDRNKAFMTAVLQLSGARIFVDASKSPGRARWLSTVDGLDVRLIHLVRDPLGFVNSMMKNTRHSISLKRSVREWNQRAAEVERLARRLPAHKVLRLRYEDLCDDPERELERVASFADVAMFRSPLSYREREHHIVGNRMRLSGGSEIRLDETWRSRLTRAQVNTVLRETFRFRESYGYN